MQQLSQCGACFALLAAVLWALAFVLFRRSGERVPPVVLNLFKNVVGLVLVGLTMLILGVPFVPDDQPAQAWLTLLFSGALGISIADSLEFGCINRLGAGRAAIVDSMYSPSVVLCAVVLLGEPLGVEVIVAVVLVSAGILIGTGGDARSEPTAAPRDVLVGVLMGLGAMLFMAVGIVVAKPVLETSNVWWAAAVRFVGAMPILLVQGSTRRYRRHVAAVFTPSRHWWVDLPAAVLGAYLALLFWIMGFKYTEASTAGVLNQTSTLLVLVFATLLLRERLTWPKVLAVAMGFAGAVLVVV